MSKILVVDDDGLFRSLLREVLELEGYAVTEAESGRQAVEYFNNEPFDLVITDIIMPDQDGLKTIFQMTERRPDVKIIAASGGGWSSPEDYLAAALQLGAQRILVKPFHKAELVRMVHDLLPVSGTAPAYTG